MRKWCCFFLLLLLLAACSAPAEPDTPPQETETLPAQPKSEMEPAAPVEEIPSLETEEPEDQVLKTLEAVLADGRTLRLEAVGKQTDEYSYGIREVRVWDGETLLQTVLSNDAIEIEWGSAADDVMNGYTSCWSPEDSMEVLDLNFDGNTDFGLFGWTPNNTIPYYYWTWDPNAGEYRYACTLQGAEANLETGELISEYKSGEAGAEYVHDYYRPDENGGLYLVRHEVSIHSGAGSNQDAERPVLETWVPKEGVTIRPVVWHDGDLILTRREVPVYEVNADGSVSHFTEIWELQDGELKRTSREEYFYEN